MPTRQSDSSEPHLSWTDHVAALLGGVVGGPAGLMLGPLLLVPGEGTFHGLEAVIGCGISCGIGLVTGYLPGLVVCFAALHILSRRMARRLGFLAAAVSAAIICRFPAAVLVGAAKC